MSSPAGWWMPAVESETAMTRAPLLGEQPRRDRAGVAEALDRDRGAWRGRCPACGAASSMQNTAPRAVASLRPSEPPSEMGLPVTTPGTV